MIKKSTDFVSPQREKLDPKILRVSVIMVIGALAPLLDSTMVNVAINIIAGDLNSTISIIQWVITGYILAMALAVPVSGWAVNRFGGKRVYMFSLFVFFAGSVLSSLSWNIDSLIGFRLLQGVGAGLMIPTLQTVLVHIAGSRNLGRVMSIVSIPALLGPILGPVLGGVIVNSLNWRWIFYVNIPITIIALLLTWRGVPTDEPSTSKQSLDIIGILLVSPGFALLIYGISQISSHGGFTSSAVLIPLVIGLLLMVAFIVYALRTKNAPVIDVRLFKSRNFSASTALLFLSGIITNGAMLLLPLYYQQVRGESVLFAGLLLIPQGVGMLLTRNWVGRLADRIGSRSIVAISLVVTMIGTVPFACAGPETNQILLAVALLIRGAGLGGLLIPIMASAYQGLSRDQVPHASSATRIFLTIGGAFGSAVLAILIEHQPSGLSVLDIHTVVSAYNGAFWWLIGFTVIAIIPALLLPLRKFESVIQ
ncbi:DHA2 family efflux MFS transporter permease subunit [Methanosphaerula palustris]|uniref:Drug resistance transporter, EmrB/QacA subfamily n=1 Tax=Methanosphaerula palustris (strain ATCC BAA-1556 / DSM 19958 / E1-9c) TaxID=521011 RepID=B8GGH7_METPE|nr:DHA2 family efflux MFS transporter permease subunit [Methanosphaerula palustris]ACL16232.1 drug resistance transporter, EmrB/QacA subfamily [Methanosphaerula palustris E1-9c]